MKLRIKLFSVMYFMFGFIFFPPAIFTVWPVLSYANRFLNYAAIFVSLSAVCWFLYNKSRINLFQIMIALFMGWLLLCDLIAENLSAFMALFSITLRLIGYMIIVSVAYEGNRKVDFLNGTSSYCAIVCVLNIISQIYCAEGIYYAQEESWQPYFVCANANSFVFFYLFTIGILTQKNILKKGSIAFPTLIANIMMIISVVMGGSTTGTVIMILNLLLLVVQSKPITNFVKRHYKQLMTVAFVVAFWFLVLGGWNNSKIVILIKNLFNEDMSYYQRGTIWASAVSNILEHPFTGYGSGTAYLNADLDGVLRSAHNSYLQIALYGGITALIIYILLIYIAVRNMKKADNRNIYFSFVTLSLYLISFMFEQNPLYIGYFCFLYISYYETRHVKPYKKW